VPFYCNPWAYRTRDNSPWVNQGACQSSRLLLSRIEIAAQGVITKHPSCAFIVTSTGDAGFVWPGSTGGTAEQCGT
jgi:hypothetical protein